MRIDQVQVATAMNRADLASVGRDPLPKGTPAETPHSQESDTAPAAAPSETQISVSIDNDKNVIYQFLDMRTGEVLQQIPPEHVLQVMRSIAELLRQSERKFEVIV